MKDNIHELIAEAIDDARESILDDVNVFYEDENLWRWYEADDENPSPYRASVNLEAEAKANAFLFLEKTYGTEFDMAIAELQSKN